MRGVAFGSILFIGAYVVYNLSGKLRAETPLQPETYKAAWRAAALAMVISLLTDMEETLGAAFGAMVVSGYALGRGLGMTGAKGQPLTRILTPPPPVPQQQTQTGGTTTQQSKQRVAHPAPDPRGGPCPPGSVYTMSGCYDTTTGQIVS